MALRFGTPEEERGSAKKVKKKKKSQQDHLVSGLPQGGAGVFLHLLRQADATNVGVHHGVE